MAVDYETRKYQSFVGICSPASSQASGEALANISEIQAPRGSIGTAAERESEQCQMFVSISRKPVGHVKERYQRREHARINAEQGGMEPIKIGSWRLGMTAALADRC